MALRLAVLASGRGSNLQAILDAIAAGTLDAEVVGVFSDKPGAPALGRVPAPLRWSRQAKDYADRARFDTELAEAVAASRPDWIVCAGYMRILDEAFVRRFRGRLLNIHPSLLPLYPGLHTHQRALAAGDAEHGATVHFVTEDLDGGPAIVQARVAVLPGDTPETLAARVLEREHLIYPLAARLYAEGRLCLRGDQATLDGTPLPAHGMPLDA